MIKISPAGYKREPRFASERQDVVGEIIIGIKINAFNSEISIASVRQLYDYLISDLKVPEYRKITLLPL